MKEKDERTEFRSQGRDALDERIRDLQEELMNLRFRHETGQLEQTAQFKTLRRRIARIKTIYNEKLFTERPKDSSRTQ